MIVSPPALRRIGWVAMLSVCCALLFGLALKVNALRSEVRLTERKILALKRETLYLETEFETRANQQQLAQWNAVEFGYVAPGAGQYLENVRALAAFGKPAGPGAPVPIRVAVAPEAPAKLPALVSPLTGQPLGEDEAAEAVPVDHDIAAAKLSERLGTVERRPPPEEEAEDTPAKAESKP